MSRLSAAWLRLPLAVRKLIVDFVETFVGLVVALNWIIPGSLDEAKAQGLLVAGAALSALISALRRAAPGIIDYLRTTFPAAILHILVVMALLVGSLFVAATPTFANDGTCITQPSHSYNSQYNIGVSNPRYFDRIVADIDPGSSSSAFSICEPDFPSDTLENGPSLWVGVIPDENSDKYGNDWAILQAGEIKCSSAGGGALCNGDSQPPSFFWAYGGCPNGSGGTYPPTPRYIDLVGDYGPHEIKLAEGTSSWYVYIDGVSRKSIYKTDPAISCWINDGGNIGVYAGEKWDAADSLGDSTTYRSILNNMQYSYDNSANFVNVDPSLGNCVVFEAAVSKDHCVEGSSASNNWIQVWTVR